MLKSILCLLLVAGSAQVDAFKKEMDPLQKSVETTVTPLVARVFSSPKATYIDSIGVIVSVEVMLEQPQNPFGAAKSAEQVKTVVNQRRKDLREKLTELLKVQVAKSTSVADTESMAVIVHLLPTTRADVGEQPTQLVLSVKKSAPTQVNVREF